MTPKGPREGRETVITFNEYDELAQIWTASGTVFKKLVKAGWVPKKDEERHAEFEVPRSRIRLPRPIRRKVAGGAKRFTITKHDTDTTSA